MNQIIDLRNTLPANRTATREVGSSSQNGRRAQDSRAVAFITCVNDEEQYEICLRYIDALQVPSGYTVEKIGVLGASSMAEGCQRGMEASTARYKAYLHQDLYLVYPGLLSELLHLFRTYPRLGLVGVEGATRLPAAVLYSVNNPFHCFGRHWTYRRPGGLSSLLGPANRRRLHFNRFRSFVGDYLPAIVVDGFFMATQYDIPWTNPLGGFELYDKVRAAEFIMAGLEVGIARQETTWCLHWGALQEPSRQQHKRRQIELSHTAGVFRQLYPAFIGMPVQRFNRLHRGTAGRLRMVATKFGDRVRDRQSTPGELVLRAPVQERLGVLIVTFNGREVLPRALRALLPQCETLNDVEYQVVVVDNASTEGTVEAVRRESPRVTVLASASNGGVARAFNVGLRELNFPSYVLVMHDDAEFSAGGLSRMVSHLREHPSTAGVVASLIDPDGNVQSQRTPIVEPVSRRPKRPRPVTFVGTTCALVRGEVFFDVGLFDERFHFHHEDLDWSLRAKRRGYKFAYLPEAKVIHYPSVGSRQHRPPIFAERSADNLWLTYKHAGHRWAVALYWAQRMQARWLAFRCRHDHKGLRQISEAMAQATSLYRRFREENRRPQLL